MTTPVPVPSKAAIRALRGLVFGTTCSLALVLETRRRRISTVEMVVHNGQRIKSHERYRADAANATIRALEEEMLLQTSRPDYYADENTRWTRPQSELPWEGREPLSVGASASKDESIQKNITNFERSHSMGSPHEELAITRAQTAKTTYAEAKRKQREILTQHKQSNEQRRGPISSVKPRSRAGSDRMGLNVDFMSTASCRINSLCVTGNKEDLARAINIVDSAFDAPIADLEPHLEELLQSTARLSMALQEAGLVTSAVKLMTAILRLHRVHKLLLDEALYWSHNPLPLVSFCMAEKVPQVDLATELLAPRFSQIPRPTSSAIALDILKTGEDLFTKLLARQSFRRMEKVLKRIKCYSCIPSGHEFELRILHQLVESGERVRAIEFFLTKASVDDWSQQYRSCYVEIADIVFDCVSDLGGYKALSVLDRLFQVRPQYGHLKVKWVTQLLYLEWQAHGSLEDLVKGFDALEKERRFKETVRYPEAPYRAMIQIILEAGDESAAREFFEMRLVAQMPSAKFDARISLLFAQARARAGDFAAMHTMLEQIKASPWTASADYAACLVPILQAFSEKHTIKQTEEFLKNLLTRYQFTPSTYMLTFMAKLYGAVRDAKSLIGWVRFCIDSGLKPGVHYSNALLRSCHKDWKFHFMELRHVYRLLHRLSPDSVNQVTANIMGQAALASPAVHRKGTINFALSPSYKPASRHPFPDRQTVAVAMGKLIENNTPSKAISMYKYATKIGMPHCQRCLRLFVDASLRQYGEARIESMLDYLRNVQETTGVDTRGAFGHLLAWQISNIDRTLGYEHMERCTQEIIQKMRSAKLAFNGNILNSAAKLYSQAGNHEGAIGLALMAAAEQGQVPGYCVSNFSILLDGYIHTQQPDMVAGLVQTATTFGHWDKLTAKGMIVLKRLKQWRRTIARMALKDSGTVLKSALAAIDSAVVEIKQCRWRLGEEKQELKKGLVQNIIESAVSECTRYDPFRRVDDDERMTVRSTRNPDNVTKGLNRAKNEFEGIAEAG